MKNKLLLVLLIFTSGCLTIKQLGFQNLETQFLNQQIFYGEELTKYQNNRLSPEDSKNFTNFTTFFLKAKDNYINHILFNKRMDSVELNSNLNELKQNLNRAEKYKDLLNE